MKVIICGSRNGCPREQLEAAIKLSGFDITEVVEGGQAGVDTQAGRWADERGIDRVTFHANWRKLGKAAGPLRNARMAAYADACIALPGHKGTANMVETARVAGLLIFDTLAQGRDRG